MSTEAFDVCVIGSGAGGMPVATVLAEAGYSVALLEKGPWYTRRDFLKDEIVQTRRIMFVPDRRLDPHVWEKEIDGKIEAWTTHGGWNATCVGGATNLMSGYFLRMKPIDFRMRSEFGDLEDARVADWPILYEDLAPYYDRVEKEIGVSGRVVDHPWADARAGDFPFEPVEEHPFADVVDTTCQAMGLHSFPEPRAILPEDSGRRRQCNYSGWCAGYGCTTEAKGSSRTALLPRALATGRVKLHYRAMAKRIVSDAKGRAVAVEYFDRGGEVHRIEARIFVLACSAIETARLLLASPGERHPQGLGNGNGLVGQNLLFSTFGGGQGDFPYATFSKKWDWHDSDEPWVNRALQDHYVIEDEKLGRRKGGTLSFLLMHPNPIQSALNEALFDEKVLWGWPLKKR
ncbi:MAG: GMC family oxidoreductase N-terminal domain-containing protein, partial [Planctomycetota bacterium]